MVNIDQALLNWIFGFMSILLGFLLNTAWQTIKDLQQEDKIIKERLTSIEVLVAGTYIKKDELDRLSDAIFAKLDKIEDKLDNKEDKK
tara:strand:- start:4878 stop:5141 length:264 start_codon:yes stop_codon:yes gene_type:complete